jgi:hypothetical protein
MDDIVTGQKDMNTFYWEKMLVPDRCEEKMRRYELCTIGPLIVLGEGRLNFGHQRHPEDRRVDFFRQTPSGGGREG